MNIAVVFNAQKNNDLESVSAIINKLCKLGAQVYMLKDSSEIFKEFNIVNYNSLEELVSNSDIVVVAGGDGTIMHIAKIAAKLEKPVLGVNGGQLGFMASIEKNQLDELSLLVDGNYKISKHMMLEVKHKDDKFFALNDIVINRAPDSQIVDYKIYKFSESICGYRSDGIIVATPTGSTAYSLSAGGPIVQSDMECMIITPICAHSLYARSMVLSSDEPIILEYNNFKGDSKVFVSIDGQVCFSNFMGGKLEIIKTNLFAKFIVLGQNNFYKNIDKKLINKNYP